MWGGVIRGFAGVKLSGSVSKLGMNTVKVVRAKIKVAKPRRSLYAK